MNEERMMKWFQFGNLPEPQKVVASLFWDLACQFVAMTDPGPERTVVLRKLLESRDSALRVKLISGG